MEKGVFVVCLGVVREVVKQAKCLRPASAVLCCCCGLATVFHHLVLLPLPLPCCCCCCHHCSDVVFTVAFTIESILKVIAFGFRPYISFFQNKVDILIVVSSLVMLFLDSLTDLQIIKVRLTQPDNKRGKSIRHHHCMWVTVWLIAVCCVPLTRPELQLYVLICTNRCQHSVHTQGLRVLRAVKPLRALTRSAGMQLIFKSLTLSLAAMGNVSIVVLLFFLIFAILGVQVGSRRGGWGPQGQEHCPLKAACLV